MSKSNAPTPEQISALIPNTFPFPNYLIDRGIWRLLDGEEQNLLTIVIRKTYGWWKRSDKISYSQLAELSGLNKQTIINHMWTLTNLGLIIVCNAGPEHQHEPNEWMLQTDDQLVNWDVLHERETERRTNFSARLAKARAARRSLVRQDPPSLVSQDSRSLVTQDPQNHPLKPSSKTISESTREPQKARPTKPTAAEQPFKYEWPPEVQELGAAFEHLWRPARRPIDRADYAFWLNGKPARNVRGLKAFASQGITTAEMQAAFKNMQKDHLTVNSPASLWSVALDLHLRSNQTHDIPAAWQSSEAAPEPEHQEPQRLSDDDHAHSAWLQVKSAFEAGETSQANYKKWIAPSQAMSLDHGTLTIAASSQDARDWLDSRLTRTAERMLIGILNEAVEVKFIVQERNP